MLKYFKCTLQLSEVLSKIVVLMNKIKQEQHNVYIHIYMLTIIVPVLLF